MTKKRLWTTIIGSHMWGMEQEGSDLDVMEVYIAGSEEFLMRKGGIYEGGKRSELYGGMIDIVKYEIGFFIENLIKGNCNFIWGLMSPLVVFRKGASITSLQIDAYSNELEELREIFKDNLSKACYHSIKGLAMQNARKYLERDRHTKKWMKKLTLICRTVEFGINLIKNKKILFKKADDNTMYGYSSLMNKLDKAYEDSDLPEKTDEQPFLDYLLKLRLENLK